MQLRTEQAVSLKPILNGYQVPRHESKKPHEHKHERHKFETIREMKKAMGIFLGLGGLSRRRLQMAQSDLGYRRDDEVLENVMRKATTGRYRPEADTPYRGG